MTGSGRGKNELRIRIGIVSGVGTLWRRRREYPGQTYQGRIARAVRGQAVARVRAYCGRVGVDRGDNLSMPAILASDAVRVRGCVHRVAAACAAGPDARRGALPAA